MELVVGCNWEEFARYYEGLKEIHDYFSSLGLPDVTYGAVGAREEQIIRSDPSQLIVWREQNQIIGHALWHETNTDEHSPGDPREEDDRENLRSLFGGRRDNLVELHELWLKTKHRRKGYGKQFFQFFEPFIQEKGFKGIIYYSDNPAAIRICQQRGYKQAYLSRTGWFTFILLLES